MGRKKVRRNPKGEFILKRRASNGCGYTDEIVKDEDVKAIGIRLPAGNGQHKTVMLEIRDGFVELRTPDGYLVVLPRYSNSVVVDVT